MDLRPDLAVERDVRVRLGVVDAEHDIDPRLDARPLGADAVFIPAEDVHGLVERGLLLRRGRPDHAIAAKLVVNFPKPPRAAVHLIPAHVRPARHAHAADLDATIDQARGRIAAALDLQP